MRLLAGRHANEPCRQRHQPPWDHWTGSTYSWLAIATSQLHQFGGIFAGWHSYERRRQCLESSGKHGTWRAYPRISLTQIFSLCQCGLLGGWNGHGSCWKSLSARRGSTSTFNACYAHRCLWWCHCHWARRPCRSKSMGGCYRRHFQDLSLWRRLCWTCRSSGWRTLWLWPHKCALQANQSKGCSIPSWCKRGHVPTLLVADASDWWNSGRSWLCNQWWQRMEQSCLWQSYDWL